MITNVITSSNRLNRDALKQAFAFGGTLLCINVQFGVTTCMQMYGYPVNYELDKRASAVFIWF